MIAKGFECGPRLLACMLAAVLPECGSRLSTANGVLRIAVALLQPRRSSTQLFEPADSALSEIWILSIFDPDDNAPREQLVAAVFGFQRGGACAWLPLLAP